MAISADSEFRRGWRIVLAAMIGIACGSSPVPFTSIGQLIGPIHESLGWSVAAISLAITLYGLSAAAMAPFLGMLADRFGVRSVAIGSLLAFGVSFGALAFTPARIEAWWLGWGLAGLVGVGSGSLVWTRGIGLWFVRERGTALGIALIGTSFTGVAMPLIAGAVVDRFGWRALFPVLALLPLALALPIVIAWFRGPTDVERPRELFEDGALRGVDVRAALQTRQFWILIVSILLIALAYGGIFVHMQQMIELAGHARGAARGVVSSMAIAILIGRVGTGWLLDRVWAPLVTLPVLGAPAIACLMLAGGPSDLTTAYLCALSIGLAAGAETDLIAFLAAKYFGMRHYGRIYGLLLLPFGVASAISPFLFGLARDTTGDYDLALHIATGMFLVGAALPLALGRYPSNSEK